MTSVVAFLVLIGVLITVHELGHFLVAKACGVKVLAFSIGFGPRLVGFTRGDTEYRISIIPLGGYVKMFGEDPTADIPAEEQRRSFLHQPYWRKSAIAVAGPLANFLLPIVIFFFMFVGTRQEPAPVAGVVVAGDAAAAAGLQAGDRVRAIAGTPVQSFVDMQALIEDSAGVPLRFAVERAGQPLELTVTPRAAPSPTFADPTHTAGRIGIVAGAEMPVVAVDDPSKVKALDRVRAVDGVPIQDLDTLLAALDTAGDRELKLEVTSPDPRDAKAEGFTRTVSLSPRAPSAPPRLQRFGVLKDELAAPELALKIGETRARTAEAQGARDRRRGLGRATGLVVQVEEGTVAAELGLVANADAVVAVDGRFLATPGDLSGALFADGDGVHVVGVLGPSGPRVLVFRMLPSPRREMASFKVFGAALMSAYGDGETITRTTSPLQALGRAWDATLNTTGEVLRGFGLMFSGRFGFESIGGPITIARLSGEAAEAGLDGFLQMMALISVNLAVLNLLPVPILDGGHLLIFTLEALLRRRFSIEARVRAMKVGLLFVGSLMLIALFNDVLGLF